MKTEDKIAYGIVGFALFIGFPLLMFSGVNRPRQQNPEPPHAAETAVVSSGIEQRELLKQPAPPKELAKVPSETKTPYQFVASKTETFGQRNTMELYAFSGTFDIAELRKFCSENKNKSPAKAFFYVVIFDNASNARFPSSPFTAEYGSEENVKRHIRAIYIYNKMNGFSELSYHADNIWDNKPARETI